MTFAKPKMLIRMRRKAWRPLNIGVKDYSLVKGPKFLGWD